MASDPYAELPVKNAKYVKNCTELHLAKKGIRRIANFDEFTNLEVLWLNDNEISVLENLEANFRIKSLYLHNNNIRKVPGAITIFTFLQTLCLSDNRLQDLHETLGILSKLQYLQTLDLFGNPLAEEPNYRLSVIKAIPSLLVFDNHAVTDEEKEEASKLHTSKNKLKHNGKAPDPYDDVKLGELSIVTKELFREAKLFKEEKLAKEREEKESLFSSLKTTESADHLPGVPLPKTLDFASVEKSRENSQLDEWEQATLTKILLGLSKSTAHRCTLDQASKACEQMKDYGRVLLAHEQLQTIFTLLDVDKTGSVDARTLLKACHSGAKGAEFKQLVQLEWGFIDRSEAGELAEEYFEKAAKLQQKIMMTTDEKQTQALLADVHEIGQKAYRLQNLASRQEPDDHEDKISEPKSDYINVFSIQWDGEEKNDAALKSAESTKQPGTQSRFKLDPQAIAELQRQSNRTRGARMVKQTVCIK